jgi:TetR/AcrR family transcriptional regulator, regulator of cefoperazone and chloramphenicol sensitivity
MMVSTSPQSRPGPASTRERILAAAGRLFARQGFQPTTVQQICRQAGANIAAVNYHFGGKGELYLAVWRCAVERTEARGRLADDLPPADWLRGFIRQRIETIFADGPGGWLPRLVSLEMENPTAHHARIERMVLEPVRARVARRVAALIGMPESSFETRMAATALMGFLPMIAHLRHRRRAKLDRDDVERLVGQTQAYILGGLDGVKRRIRREAP